jgi:hypothetical protein
MKGKLDYISINETTSTQLESLTISQLLQFQSFVNGRLESRVRTEINSLVQRQPWLFPPDQDILTSELQSIMLSLHTSFFQEFIETQHRDDSIQVSENISTLRAEPTPSVVPNEARARKGLVQLPYDDTDFLNWLDRPYHAPEAALDFGMEALRNPCPSACDKATPVPFLLNSDNTVVPSYNSVDTV